jgi:hypothetical protein
MTAKSFPVKLTLSWMSTLHPDAQLVAMPSLLFVTVLPDTSIFIVAVSEASATVRR